MPPKTQKTETQPVPEPNLESPVPLGTPDAEAIQLEEQTGTQVTEIQPENDGKSYERHPREIIAHAVADVITGTLHATEFRRVVQQALSQASVSELAEMSADIQRLSQLTEVVRQLHQEMSAQGQSAAQGR